MLRIVHHHAFGDLDRQFFGGNLGLFQHGVDALVEMAAIELDGRDVDGNPLWPQPGIEPSAQLSACLLQRPGSELDDEAALFG